jgi:hypothetical protein
MRASDEVAAAAAVQASSEQTRVEVESSDVKERIEAALLGAMETDDPVVATREGREDGQSETEAKRKTIDKTAERAKSLLKKTRVAGGFSKYDVVVMKDSKNDLNMPQLLEGSLKDLLKDGLPSKRRRSSGDQNYELFLTCIRHFLHSRSCPNCFFHHGKLEPCWIKQFHPTVSPRVTYTLPYRKTQSFQFFKVMQKT